MGDERIERGLKRTGKAARVNIETRMTSEIVGRNVELGTLHAFLDRATEGPAALVLQGDAGIGKSTLWLAGVEGPATEVSSFSLASRPRPRPGSRSPG